jgi:hypothetical protein
MIFARSAAASPLRISFFRSARASEWADSTRKMSGVRNAWRFCRNSSRRTRAFAESGSERTHVRATRNRVRLSFVAGFSNEIDGDVQEAILPEDTLPNFVRSLFHALHEIGVLRMTQALEEGIEIGQGFGRCCGVHILIVIGKRKWVKSRLSLKKRIDGGHFPFMAPWPFRRRRWCRGRDARCRTRSDRACARFRPKTRTRLRRPHVCC